VGRGLQAAVGLAASVGAARLLGDVLFGVSAHDLTVLSFVTVVLLGTALVANGLPARRAARRPPITRIWSAADYADYADLLGPRTTRTTRIFSGRGLRGI
jgi:hypothetical protein